MPKNIADGPAETFTTPAGTWTTRPVTPESLLSDVGQGELALSSDILDGLDSHISRLERSLYVATKPDVPDEDSIVGRVAANWGRFDV